MTVMYFLVPERHKMTSALVWCLCLLLVSVPCYSGDEKKGECVRGGPCRCSFPNGMTIDLSDVALRFNWLSAGIAPNMTLFLHLCSDQSLGTEGSGCFAGASVCLLNHTAGTYEVLGLASEAQFLSEGEFYSAKYLQYNHGGRLTTFGLNCDTVSKDISGTNLVSSIGNTEDNHLKLELTSFSACATMKTTPKRTAGVVLDERGLSTGSVLVILFFVFSAIYFVGGALALRLLRGARGREMLPHADFWNGLPSLIRDGVTFTLSGCRPVPGTVYDSI